MSRLHFLLTTSVLAIGCGGDVCGSADAPEFGLMVTGASTSFGFGGLAAGANNDCPDAAAPPGVISLTISGTESTGAGLVTFCIPRPDLLADDALPLGTGVQIIDLNSSVATCTYSLDRSRPISGTVTSSGMCGNGTDLRGFSLAFNGTATLRRTCGAAIDPVDITLQGQVAVAGSTEPAVRTKGRERAR